MRTSVRNKTVSGRQTLADMGLGDKSVARTRPIPGFVNEVGALGVMAARVFRLMLTAKTDGDTLKLVYRYTNRSLFFIVTAMAFVGMIMVYQSTEQLARAVGDTHLVGPSFLKLSVRVLGPTIIGMLIACRIGAGIAAEIGAMAVTDQLNAMKICFADPIEVLMVTRVRACIVASFVLTIIGTAALVFSGFATAYYMYSFSWGAFWSFELLSMQDVLEGMIKALIYGAVVPLTSGAFGFKASGGAGGVGSVTTDAVVGSSFAIVLLDSIISLIGYVAGGL